MGSILAALGHACRGYLSRLDGQRDAEPRSTAGSRGDPERPAQGLKALLDAQQPEAPPTCLPHHLVDGKSNPVVLKTAVDDPVVSPELEAHVGSRGMFGDVGEALLYDAIEGGLDSSRQPFFYRAIHVNVEPCARGHPFHQKPQGGEEA